MLCEIHTYFLAVRKIHLTFTYLELMNIHFSNELNLIKAVNISRCLGKATGLQFKKLCEISENGFLSKLKESTFLSLLHTDCFC